MFAGNSYFTAQVSRYVWRVWACPYASLRVATFPIVPTTDVVVHLLQRYI